MPPLTFKRPSYKMKEYMLILFNDVGFTLRSRNAWLSDMFRREIKDLDDLFFTEGLHVISKLRQIKEDQKT